MPSSGPWRAARRRAAGWGCGLALAAALPLLSGCADPPRKPRFPVPEADPTIEQVLAMTPDPDQGRIVFRSWCIFCHGDQQAGEPPTDFGFGDENPRKFRGYADELNRRDHVTAVVKGYVSKNSGHQNMPSFLLRIPARDIADVVAYERGVMALKGPYVEPPHRVWEGLPDWYEPGMGQVP